MPASGWSCSFQACSPTRSSSCEIVACRRGGTGGGRGRPAPRRARCCRRRRAGSARAPGCRRAPAPCRDSRAACAHDALGAVRAPARCRTAAGCARHRLAHHVVQPAQVVLHRADFGQAVERAHDEEGVAQPAVAVVPVALAVGASGMLVVIAATMAPVSSNWHSLSVIAARITASCHSSGIARRRVQWRQYSERLLLEVARGLLDAARQRLVGPEQQADRRVQREPGARRRRRSSGASVVRRSVSRRQHVAQVVAAARERGLDACPIRSAAGARCGCAGGRSAAARGAPAAPGETTRPWCRKRGAKSVISTPWPAASNRRVRNDRRAGVVGLLAARRSPSSSIEAQAVRRALPCGRIEQRMEHRIAVEARHAAPDDRAPAVDQRADGAVADHARSSGAGAPSARCGWCGSAQAAGRIVRLSASLEIFTARRCTSRCHSPRFAQQKSTRRDKYLHSRASA